MIDQGKFLKLLQNIIERAKQQNQVISKEELNQYLSEAELSVQQMESVYAYLAENKITVLGFVPTAPVNEQRKEEKKEESESVYLKMYKEDLQQMEFLQDEKKEELFQKFLTGDMEARQHLQNSCLHDVPGIAAQYKGRGVRTEDLIQEGNIGLMSAFLTIPVNYTGTCKDFIKEKIEEAVIRAIDEARENVNYEDAIVAKANLIREAAKYMEEDLGRAPSVEELEKYTRISGSEIRDILNLSKE